MGCTGEVRFASWTILAVALGIGSGAFRAPAAEAQTDYYNLDRHRPVRIEDAYATERYAIEVKLAPVRLARGSGGVYEWGFDPSVAFGVLPRTSIEVGVPYAITEASLGEPARRGVTGIELSLFHNLNVETRTLPALGFRADLVLPVGGLAGDEVVSALTGIATRTFRWGRLHANGQHTLTRVDGTAEGVHEVPRWLAGVAVDRAFPLDAFLVIADLHVAGGGEGGGAEWNGGVGLRYQLSPSLAVDVGAGRRLSGAPEWHLTFGAARHLGLRTLIPGLP